MNVMRLNKWIPALLPLVIFWLTGVAGLDYGYHWDEPKLLESVRVSVYEGLYLPTFYNYPSVSHDLGVLAALPEILSNIDRNHLNELVFHGHIAAYQLDQPGVTLRTRLIFLTLTSLTIIWIYGLMLGWHGSVWLALFSSSFVAFSWEVAYHARWIAPDAILMQFGGLWLWCVVQAYHQPEQSRWSWGSVMVAGLATGTKYPAGLLLLPTLLLIHWRGQSRLVHSQDDTSVIPYKKLLLKAVFVFGLTYLMTTPGTLLQPFKFWNQVEFEMWHYSFGHSKHTVSAGFEHLLKNIEYLSTVQLSHFPVIAILLFSLSLVGMIALWRESRRMMILIGLFPLLYLVYMSMQRAMLIRNLLILVPFVAVYAGLGMGWLWRILQVRWLRILLIGVAVIMMSVNAMWLVYAAQSITYRHTDAHVNDLRAWVSQHPDTTYYATTRVVDTLGDDVPNNITSDLSMADEVLAYLKEIQEVDPMPSNIPRLFTRQFGSWEANVDYYTWHGDDKIVVMSIDAVRQYQLTSYVH